jgi:AcrB/AcrD/AcrF family
LKLPPGYRLEWGGQFENQQRASARLAIVVPVALGLILLLLYLTFNSLRQAVLVFCNVPFAAIGGVIALRLSGEYLSVPASVGFIALIGIAILNGVVLISYINRLIGGAGARLASCGSGRRQAAHDPCPTHGHYCGFRVGAIPVRGRTGCRNPAALGRGRDRRPRQRNHIDPLASPAPV